MRYQTQMNLMSSVLWMLRMALPMLVMVLLLKLIPLSNHLIIDDSSKTFDSQLSQLNQTHTKPIDKNSPMYATYQQSLNTALQGKNNMITDLATYYGDKFYAQFDYIEDLSNQQFATIMAMK